MPLRVAFVPSTGEVLVSNGYRHQVERFQSIDDMTVIGTPGTGQTGRTLWKQLGSAGTEPGQFDSPRAVAVTSTGPLVVSDERCVQVLTVEGAVLCVLDPLKPIMDVGVGRWQLGGSHYGLAAYRRDPLHGLLQRSFLGAVVVS